MATNPGATAPAILPGDAERLLQLIGAFSVAMPPGAQVSAPNGTQPKGRRGNRARRNAKQSREEDAEEEEEEQDQEEDDPTPKGMLGECKPLYQVRDKDGRWQWVAEEPEDVGEAVEGKATAKFAFLVRKRKSDDSRKKYDIDSVIVQSPLLKERLAVVLKDYPGITTSLERLVFQAPFRPFVHRWPQLVQLLDPNETTDETARQHLQLFHDVLYEELKNPISAKLDLVKNNVITFEYLWTILEPGSLIFGFDDGKERVWQLNSSSTSQQNGVFFESLNVWGVDQDAEKFGRLTNSLKVFEFAGTAKITSLRAFPLDFHSRKAEVTHRLVERGRLFEKYAGYNFEHYKGNALTHGRCGMIKVNLDSRVIIDCEAYNRFLPNHAVYLSTLEVPKQSGGSSGTSSADEEQDDYEDSYSEVSSGDYLPTPDPEATDSKPKRRKLSEKELLLAVPYVRGYAIKAKTWFWLYVDQISPIKFNENAFESLVLDAGHKKLIKACVDTQRKHKMTFDDVITGKGRGMIMLLAGPPGVGKTLTAESVSEHMKVPLYMMSAGDLGLDPGRIEEKLDTVMDMVAKWNAVLLLDEADVFLEARSTHDLERNKLVSIFLRVLEYYEGILFLTTNRINNIDDAFHSRIHLTVNYPKLSSESRRHIWSTFLGSKTAIKLKELEVLASIDLNGRQIKNVIKTAQMLARSEWEDKDISAFRVQMKHIQTVLAVERSIISE